MFQNFGITVHFFQALQAYWDELSASRSSAQYRPAKKRTKRMKQLLSFSGGVMIALGLKLGGQRQLSPG